MNKFVQNCNHCPTELIIENIDPTVYPSLNEVFQALKEMQIGIITDVVLTSIIPLYIPNGPPVPTMQVKILIKKWNLFPTREMRRWFEEGLRVTRKMANGGIWYMSDVKQQHVLYLQRQREYERRCMREDEESQILYYPAKPANIGVRNPRSRRLGRDYRASEAELCEMGEVCDAAAECHTGNPEHVIDIEPEQIEIVINV
jgi:hypothetical protein